MTKILYGKVRGRTIELDEDLGVADGQAVEVHLKLIPTTSRTPGEGFLVTEGALAGDTEWDAIMAEIHETRKLERRPRIPDMGEP